MKHKIFTIFIFTLIAATTHATTWENNTFQPNQHGSTSLLAGGNQPSAHAIWKNRAAGPTNAINLLASYRDEDGEVGKNNKKWNVADDFKLRGVIEKIRTSGACSATRAPI